MNYYYFKNEIKKYNICWTLSTTIFMLAVKISKSTLTEIS